MRFCSAATLTPANLRSSALSSMTFALARGDRPSDETRKRIAHEPLRFELAVGQLDALLCRLDALLRLLHVNLDLRARVLCATEHGAMWSHSLTRLSSDMPLRTRLASYFVRTVLSSPSSCSSFSSLAASAAAPTKTDARALDHGGLAKQHTNTTTTDSGDAPEFLA